MIPVFVARHPTEAHFVRDLLAQEGIDAEVRGEALFGARGEAPVTAETLPSVWIARDGDVERARAIVAGYERGEGPASAAGRPWRCVRCGEELEAQFTACWKCASPRAAEG